MSNSKVPITRLGKYFSEGDFFFRDINVRGMVNWRYELHLCIISC